MNRRAFIKRAALAPALASVPFNSPDGAPEESSRNTSAAGALGRRYELSLRRVLSGGPPVYTPDFVLADVRPEPERRFTNFSGDLSGRYVGALALAARHYGKEFPQCDELVPRIIGLQKPDGHFGADFHFENPKDNDLAILWGNGRLLVGLLEYDRVKPRPQIRASAKRIGDFLIRVGPLMNSDAIRRQFDSGHFATGYICWTQNIEGLAELYRVTTDSSYKVLAERISRHVVRHPSEHVHGFLTSLRGMVDLCKVTGDQHYLEQAEREWHAIASSKDLLVTGGVPEQWSPANMRTEGCAEADWIRLSLALWALTEKPEYLAMAEKTIFNEFAMNQFETGDFGHRMLTPTGIAGNHDARAWWCCSLHGLRCFPDIVSAAFRTKPDAIYYDLPVDGRVESEGLLLSAVSSLDRDGSVRLVVLSGDVGDRRLEIRQPDWAADLEVSINGKRPSIGKRDDYRRISHHYKPGDVISIHYVMKTRVIAWRDTARGALFHGPWLLGVPKSADSPYFDEPSEMNRLRVGGGPQDDVRLDHACARNSETFAVPEAEFQVKYLPGGYPCQPQEATLCPVSEQTRGASTDWEFLFNTEGTS